MSPLWKLNRNKVTRKQNPSPNHVQHFIRLAQDVRQFFVKMCKKNSPQKRKSIKGISLQYSGRKCLGASMTVEASLILPLFLFFFLNLSSVIECMRLHQTIEVALWETGNRLSVYGYPLSSSCKTNEKGQRLDTLWQELADVSLSYLYVKKQIVDYAGKDYFEKSPLTYGVEGLQFLGSEYCEPSDELEIVVTYKVSPFYALPAFPSFLMENHYYGHLWTGYEIISEDSIQQEKLYYVTENGEVYHITKNCTYLNISKREVSFAEALLSLNAAGERYGPCERCKNKGGIGKVWITESGDCYHKTQDCPALIRKVYAITEREINQYRLCTRCAKGGT